MVTHTRLYIIILSCITLCLAACTNEVTPSGQVAFWNQKSDTLNTVTVDIAGQTARITADFTIEPACSEDGTATFILEPGTYDYTAVENGNTSRQWTGRATVNSDKCAKILLQK